MNGFRRRLMMANQNLVLPKWFQDTLVCWYNPKRQGITNEDMTVLKDQGKPQFLKDFSENHLDMELKGFSWSGMSGMNGYEIDINQFRSNAPSAAKVFVESDNLKIITDGTQNGPIVIYTPYFTGIKKLISFDIRTNLADIQITIRSGGSLQKIPTNINGITTVDFSQYDIPPDNEYLFFWTTGKGTATVKIKPTYPDALVFDGTDSFGVSKRQPLLKDYTVIAKRFVLSTKSAEYLASKKPDGAFVFEAPNDTWSFGKCLHHNYMPVKYPIEGLVSYQTKHSYNGFADLETRHNNDIDILYLATVEGYKPLWSGAIYQFLLFNRTLNENEINWIKEKILK